MSASRDTMAEKEFHISKETRVPEWEHVAAARAEQGGNIESNNGIKTHRSSPFGATAAWSSTFDRVLPPHRTYLRLSRKRFLIVLLCAFLALLALIIGLAVGLQGSSKTQNLPLPSNAETHTGELTYYATGLGACGYTNADGDKIVAVSHLLFDAAGSTSNNGGNSNANPLCGRMLRAKRYNAAADEERSVDLKVVDRCTGCQPTDLDITQKVFEYMADVDQGRVDVTWAWL